MRRYIETEKVPLDRAQGLALLAFWLATDPDPSARDGGEALRLAESAITVDSEDPQAFDALAAAYAEAGRFDEAVAVAKAGLEAAQAAGDSAAARTIEGRIRLYEMRRPYRRP
jgi:tetratricopeptide (TPR) repeat protein